MRFEDEQYVRLYRRDTTTWLMLPWQGRCVLPLILKACDRAGIIDLGDDGWEGLAVTIKVPVEIVVAAMPEILRRGILALRDDGMLVWPRFIEAQEAKQSDKARQKSMRDRARDLAMAAKRGVEVLPTPDYPPLLPQASESESVTHRNATVTPRDEPSRVPPVLLETVTLSCEVKRSAEQGGARGAPAAGEPPPSPLALAVPEPEKSSKRRRRARLPLTFLPADWQPDPVDAEDVRAKGLDLEAVLVDFRGYWRGKGEAGADWGARFKQNTSRIMRTDWLRERLAAPPTPVRVPLRADPSPAQIELKRTSSATIAAAIAEMTANATARTSGGTP
jgi:hypothetical protein